MSDDTGYELDDPKHPTYYERYADTADHARKAMREDQMYRYLRNSEVTHERAELTVNEMHATNKRNVRAWKWWAGLR